MRKVTRAHCRRQQHRILVDEEGSYDEDQLTSSWALVRDQAPRGIHCSPVCLRHARGINPAETPAGPSWGHYGPSALPVPAGTGEGSSMGPVEETGTVMKRMSTLAGMAAPPASASLSVASFSAGDSTGTGSATVAETRRRVDRPVRRPVHRHVGADGPDRQGGALQVARRDNPPRLQAAGFLTDVACTVGIAPHVTASNDQGFALGRGRGHLPRPVPPLHHRTPFLNSPLENREDPHA